MNMKKLYKSLSFTAALLLMLASVALAQERVVSGKVTDENGSGMPGVNVLVKGTTTGTSTDVDGKYKISVPGDDAVLVFTFVGYASQEVTVGSRTVNDVALTPDVETLTELVVTGYAVQEKKDITGSVGVVKTSDLVSVPASNADQMIQGRVAGVTVVQSAVPGTAAIIRIRGFSALQGNSAPLYVVDGTPTYDITTFNPYDIETISVLKDAGAASIYGARAANGVIVVTTKKGTKDGKTRVTYDTYYSIQDPGKGFTNLLDPQGQADLEWLANDNDGVPHNSTMYGTGSTPVLPNYILPSGYSGPEGAGTPVDPALYNINYANGPIYQIVKANKSGTNWFKEVTRKAPMQTHNLSIAGNGDNSKYYIGLNYFNQQGIIIDTYAKRMSIRANTEFTIKKKVRIGENFSLTYADNPGNFNNLSEGNTISQSYRLQRIIPVYDIKGGFAGSAGAGLGNASSPFAQQERTKNNQSYNTRLFGSLYAEADIFKGVTAKTLFGGFLGNFYGRNFTYRTYENSENNPSNGYAEFAGYGGSWNWTNTISIKKTFGDHNLGVVLGSEAVKRDIGRSMNASRINYFSDNPNYWSLNNGGAGISNGGGPSTPSTLFSLFARADYGFKDKYLLSGTIRRDGSSRFGPNNKYGVFPSVTAGWRVSGENFMSSISSINDMKIRAGWGTMGSDQNLSANNQYSQYGGEVNTSFYDITGANSGSVQGFRQTRFGNLDTKWETNETTNIGLDLTILDNKLDVSLDVYKKVTKDLLFSPEYPGTYGFVNTPSKNIGQMTNKGIDLQMIYHTTIANDWKLELNGTLTKYKNNVDKIATGYTNFFVNSGELNRLGDYYVNNAVGHPISAFYGYKIIGMNQVADTVGTGGASGTGLKQEGGLPGTFKYADTNGDGKVTEDDKQFLGSPNPKFTYGLNINLSYKNFDLTVFLYGSYGNKIMNYTKWWTDFNGSFKGAKSTDLLNNSWTPERTNGTVPMASNSAEYSSISTNKASNDYYLENGSYLRARNIMLAYNLPTATLNRIGFAKARIFVQAVNLFTVTKYSGLNPELGGSDQANGVDLGSYPVPKQYTIGLTLSL
jgi:TonB-dependent starch-binding outer membrane protein SusC